VRLLRRGVLASYRSDAPVKLRSTLMTALIATAASTALTSAALTPAALAMARTPRFETPKVANTGQAPSLSLAVSDTGVAGAAVIGKRNSLWYFASSGGSWRRTEVAPADSAFGGPSLFITAAPQAEIAVQGGSHTLVLYVQSHGHWRHTQIADRNHAYSAPSLYVGPSGPGIAVQGPGHTLWYYWAAKGHWQKNEVAGSGTDYSAASLVIRSASQTEGSDHAGQADIAVQGAAHTLTFYRSQASGHWKVTPVAGPNRAYSAPSLIVGYDALQGQANIAVQGPGHSLLFHADVVGSRPGLPVTLDTGDVFSAPSMTQNGEDIPGQYEIAFQGLAPHSVTFLYYNPAGAGSFVNDVITGANGQVNSAPSLFARTIPTGEYDLIFQGRNNTLFYYHALRPISGGPVFAGAKIGAAGTTFGG
jgi:hypothetical protein